MSHKVSTCEVLVAGGGIIGAACARAVALQGLRVAICEPGPEPAAASAASAGILGAQIERTDESLRALGLRGRDLYESLAAALLETTGIDIELWREGIASLAFDESEAERLRDAVAHQRQAGLRCDWLEASEVAERFPAAAPSQGALFAPEDGAANAPVPPPALLANATRLFPALASRGPMRSWAGLRPVTPDGRPIVGADPDVRGLWYATGHGRNGVLLAALTGEIIANLVTTGTSEIEIASLAPERFTS